MLNRGKDGDRIKVLPIAISNVQTLPVGYFHTVFTIPQELNTLVLQNQKLLYSLLIKSTGHTLMELAKDPQFLGAIIGITTVLHTWGQNLSFHPHVHCIVPNPYIPQCHGENIIKSSRDTPF